MSIAANPEGGSGRTLVYVHGKDFKPPADELLDISVAALTAGIERDAPQFLDAFNALQKRIAYYGDCSNAFLREAGQRYDETLDLEDRRNALIQLRNLDKKKHFGVRNYDRLPGKTALPEFAADTFAPLLMRLGLSDALIRKVGVDVAEYWNPDSDFGSTLRGRVRDAVIAALDSSNELFLISHGTGCVVTWDVLWQLSHDDRFAPDYAERKIDVWLTAGAPLGDSMVQRRLFGAGKSGVARYPTNIVSWHNVSAEDDYVSHDDTVADDFSSMMKQHQVSCIRDYCVYNLAVRYGRSNPHASLGYLVHPRVTQLLTEWLQRMPLEELPEISL